MNKIVRENIEFNRGGDPRKALGIGKEEAIKTRGDSIGWDWDDSFNPIFRVEKYEIYKGIPIKINSYKVGKSRYYKYNTASNYPKEFYKGEYKIFGDPDGALESAKKVIDKFKLGESIEFERYEDPKENIGIGRKKAIRDWMELMEVPISIYSIREDGEIDVIDDIIFINKGLEELPPYIKFNTIGGSFYAGGNPWKSLRGFPRFIHGDLQLWSPSAPPFFDDYKRFSKEEILRNITVYGKIWN